MRPTRSRKCRTTAPVSLRRVASSSSGARGCGIPSGRRVNAFSGAAGKGTNLLTNAPRQPFGATARAYKAARLRWVVIGEPNCGEGSSREHAALSPRRLGGVAVIVRSFARIHETNLKKQGLAALTFQNFEDYDRIREDDRINLLGLAGLAPGVPVTCRVSHADGTTHTPAPSHSFSADQVKWFRAGGALNLVGQAR